MTIKLGILVVYMVSDGDEKLIELHLSRIEQHTTVPYTIYGSVNRLRPQHKRKLEQHPTVKLYEFPATDLRGSAEHSYYLERLVRLAIDDGASHIMILHVDSFPIRDGWIEALVGKLSGSCVFATIEGIDTACLLFQRDFYLTYRPTVLLAEEERESSEYKKYFLEVRPTLHSGIGYGFKAYQEGLSWYYMRASSRDAAWNGTAIYDDLLFHLKGAVRLSAFPSRRIPRPLRWLGYTRLESFVRAMDAIVPTPIKLLLRANLKRPLESLFDLPRLQWLSEAMASARDQLMQDPDSYIEQLRGPRQRPDSVGPPPGLSPAS
jgi:hypothetical protein